MTVIHSKVFAGDEPAYIRLDKSAYVSDSLSESTMTPRSDNHCPVLGSVWSLSQSPAGCRQVQEALASAPSQSAREALAQELRGHVVKGMKDAHANHVLQKCISTMSAPSLQFMIDELLVHGGSVVSQCAKHRYGGRIVQQLLKKCEASQVNGLAEALLQDAVELSCHTFANYSMQHLLQFGTAEHRHRMVHMIEGSLQTVASSVPGGGVIATTLAHAAPEDQVFLARSMLKDPALLVNLAQNRHGNGAVLQMARVLDGLERVQLRLILTYDIDVLRGCRFGRTVVRNLDLQGGLPQ